MYYHYLSTVSFIFITLFFIWRGYQKGLGGTLIRIGSCFLGYVIAIFLTNPLASLISKINVIDGLIIYVISGTFILALVIIICDVSGNRAFDKMIYKKPISESAYLTLKFGGAVIGILVGCFFGFISSYLINFKVSQLPAKVAQIEKPLEGAQNIPLSVDNTQVQEVVNHDSFIDKLSKKVVSEAVTTVVKVVSHDEASIRIAKIISRDPQLSISHFRNIANDKEIMHVFSDEQVQEKLRTGSVEMLLEDQKFSAMMLNPNLHFLKPVSQEYSNQNPDSNPDIVATKIIVKSWNRFQEIKNNPRVIEILSDKQFQQKLRYDNAFDLMMNKELKELTDIILNKN